GIEPGKDIIRQGLQKAVWTGRFQYLSHKPDIIIDGAHNVQGIQTLITNLDILYPKQKLVFIIAILRDKNLKGVIDLICTKASFIYISRNSSTRAAECEDQTKYVKANRIDYDIADTVINAYKQAVEKLSANDVLVITGSLYTISEIIAQYKSCS
ncbi:MAG: bifunctional tetrahydrofolate synthase/dihydrofolate synthase, partial [Candidatus Cloacimonetes bacterium]|nr:bifunctional tetrahydrofolate synthase/dihydrofolate synthase [Candidatus Cloacimonadota bacterium]